MSEPKTYTNRNILEVKNMSELRDEYMAVSRRLHGDQFVVTVVDFERLINDPKELIAFVLIEGQLVATAQATLQWTPPQLQAYINNVVTSELYGGKGLGRLVMESLENNIKQEWGESGARTINLGLSNSPTKNNGGFYEALGWTSRGADSDNPTVMWVKSI